MHHGVSKYKITGSLDTWLQVTNSFENLKFCEHCSSSKFRVIITNAEKMKIWFELVVAHWKTTKNVEKL